MMLHRRIRSIAVAVVVVLMLATLLFVFGPVRRPDLWLTPDQRGDRLCSQARYTEAAKVYSDPVRQGVAEYRAGDFKAAATAFSHAATPVAVFNHANALFMQGKYGDAIQVYDRALHLRPEWIEAQENRDLAVIRRDRITAAGDNEASGQLDPDGIIVDPSTKKAGEAIQVKAGPALSDRELQALWLRRVQTSPADFLRSKFAIQSAQPVAEEVP